MGEVPDPDGHGGEVRLLTVAEVARMLHMSRMTVYRMVGDGRLPAIKVGRAIRIRADTVTEFLERAHSPGSTETGRKP